jgi:hypothetical protein
MVSASIGLEFAELMASLNEPAPESAVLVTVNTAEKENCTHKRAKSNNVNFFITSVFCKVRDKYNDLFVKCWKYLEEGG